MQKLSSASIIIIAVSVCQAQTQGPVLAWSARIGPDLQHLTGVSAAPDGGMFVAGRTTSVDAFGVATRNSSVFVGRLGPEGDSSSVCLSTIGGTSEDLPYAMAVGSDGAVVVAGFTEGATFPATPGALLVRPQDSSFLQSPFLASLDPCGAVRFATFLPKDLAPAALAIGADGSVYLAAQDRSNQSEGVLLRIDAAGRQVLAQVKWIGVAGALAVDSAGRVTVTGLRGSRMVITRFSTGLQRTEFDTIVGDATVSFGTALAIATDGSTWVAGGASPPGRGMGSLVFEPGVVLPGYQNLAATLTRLNSNGSVAFHRIIELPDSNVSSGFRRPVGVGIGPDGRVWVGIAGPTGFPQMMPERERVVVNAVYLRSFYPDGLPAGGETLVPGLRSAAGLPAVAFGPGGRVVTAGLNPFLPVTPGSADSQTPGSTSVVAFDLGAASSPRITADREMLHVDSINFAGKTIVPQKSVRLFGDDIGGKVFVASVIPNSPYPAFVTPDTTGSLPASVRVDPIPGGTGDGVLVVLAPGTQGLPAIPLRSRWMEASWLVELLSPLHTVGPQDEQVQSVLRIAASARSNAIPTPLNVPFSVATNSPWLKLGAASGTTPAEIQVSADPSGLSSGVNHAQVLVTYEDRTQTFPITLIVGPVIRIEGLSEIGIPAGQSVTHKFRILSSSTPIDFTLDTTDAWLQLTPTSGRTPQEITVTATPLTQRIGEQLFPSVGLRHAAGSSGLSLRYVIKSPQAQTVPDILAPDDLAPGSLFAYNASTSVCGEAEPQATPWPVTLGGCTLRANGRALPIGGIAVFTYSGLPGQTFRTSYAISAQLPYDVEPGPLQLELEDRDGRKTQLSATITLARPLVRGVEGLETGQTLSRQVGQDFTLRLSGMGRLQGNAPWGDVATSALASVLPIKAFVGGRTAPVLSAELSRSEVGILRVRVQVPAIAADIHVVNLVVGDLNVLVGSMVVTAVKTSLAGFQNGASYRSNQVSPGGVITLYGSGMGPQELVTFQLDSAGKLPLSLSGTQILLNGVPAPLLYVSSTQASAIAPFALEPQKSVQVVVQSGSGGSAPLTVPVLVADPGIFSRDRQGSGQGAILNQDGSLNSAENPATPNSVVVLFGAGFGKTTPLLEDGRLTSATNPPRLLETVSVTIGNLPATVEYAGPAPGAVAGLYQVNARVPPTAPAGNLRIQVTVGTAVSQDGLTVAVGTKAN